MKDLKNVKVGITHGGKFHTDDVISTVFIKYFNPLIEIKRVLEYTDTPNDDEIVYDIGLGEFDHHQENRLIDDNNHPYSAFGLLFEVYGREYLKKYGFNNIEEGFLMFKEKYVYKIDEGDNESYRRVSNFRENNLIMSCNLLWFEEDSIAENKAFDEAVKLGTYLFENWTRDIYLEVENL